jgi:sugar lactone lactonase YvrE
VIAGKYAGVITISNPSATPAEETVPVNITLTDALTVTPGALNFQTPQGSPAQSQMLQIGGSAARWQATATASGGGNWLSVFPQAGPSQTNPYVLVSPGGLAPGTYQGTVTIQAPNVTPPLVAVNVTLRVAGGQGAAAYTITTLAGGGLPSGIPGTSANPGFLGGLATDSLGNVFCSDENGVLRLDAITGIITLVAGGSTAGYSGDNGPAINAMLNGPTGLAFDSSGNLYITDTGNNLIRMVAGGVITTVAGNGTYGFGGDNGPATSAQLAIPAGVAVDSAGNVYIADSGNNVIRKVSNGVITTVAGNGMAGFNGDRMAATGAALNLPVAVAVDSASNLYIADSFNARVRMVVNGVITTVAGNGNGGYIGDGGPATSAGLEPTNIVVPPSGDLYILDGSIGAVRKVANGVITTVAGGLSGPSLGGFAVDPAGVLYVRDVDNTYVQRIANGVTTTVLGKGEYRFNGDNGPASSAELNLPRGLAVDSNGNAYIADDNGYQNGGRIRQVSSGVINTVAGGGATEVFGLGGGMIAAASAEMHPLGIALDSAGSVYFTDASDGMFKVSNGFITTVVKEGGGLGSEPCCMAADSLGNVYVASPHLNQVFKVANGTVTAVAGGGTAGYIDNAPATSVQLGFLRGVAVDSAGNLYIADDCNIREVSNGMITTVAGNGKCAYSGDYGPATSAGLSDPYGIAVDSAGNLFIAEDARIREVSNGVITTIAGNGVPGFSGDNGPATNAQIWLGEGYSTGLLAVDSAGNLYLSDTGNQRIRMLTPAPAQNAAQRRSK